MPAYFSYRVPPTEAIPLPGVIPPAVSPVDPAPRDNQ